ncbi:hypothetical protein EMPS_07769 [Entomortierella parvispora]|uniref:Ndc10 domain-containing protein n=1 Tax=Entomortierella parvispora TaxID=205924 RepID=A0A9P3HER4_9FUNG|nr:hypothetical protein EMPS_07769 [Entomortierella parvispora]
MAQESKQQGKRPAYEMSGADGQPSDQTRSPSPPRNKRAKNRKELAAATDTLSAAAETNDAPQGPKHRASVDEAASAQYQAGKPPTRKKKHGGSLTHLPLCNNQDVEKALSEEELERRRIESANFITDQVLLLQNPGVTVFCHQGRIRDWRDYCIERHGGDTRVNAVKIIQYLKDVIFKVTTKKLISPKRGYDGVIGTSTTKEPADGMAPRQEQQANTGTGNSANHDAQVEDNNEIWSDDDGAEGEDDDGSMMAYEVESRQEREELEERDTELSQAPRHTWVSVDDDSMAAHSNLTTHEKPVANGEKQPKAVVTPTSLRFRPNERNQGRTPAHIDSIADKAKVFDDAETDNHGRRVIYVPRTLGTVLNIKKALVHLWEEQRGQQAPYPNRVPHPGFDKTVKTIISNYGLQLVKDSLNPGTSRSAACSLRDPYSERMFIRMLSYLWRNLPIKAKSTTKRPYSTTRRYAYHRERLCLLARHHMLLRDEDIRGVTLSDLFHIQRLHKAPGSKMATGLTFTLTRGKTNQEGVRLYGTAFRHKDYRRCTVGGFAFYMLERWQIDQEPLPDFADPDEWSKYTLLVDGSSPEERAKKDRKTPIHLRTQINSTAAIMRTCEVYSTKVTHGGRHAGTSEAYHLGLELEHIRHLGRWVMGQMENFYAPKNPVIGAFYMAHFNHMDKPYLIERDLVTPPLDLQRQIFPWIEKVFDDPRIKRLAPSWIKTCDEEMEGGDTNAASETDVWWKMNEEDVEGDQCGHDHVSSAYEHGSIVDLIAFLKLMVRMRRVILQDSVMFMEERGPDGVTMMNKLLASDQMQQIFIRDDFLQFKENLLDDIKRHKEERARININEELNNTVIADAVNGMSNETSESHARQERLLKEILVSIQQSQYQQAALEHQQYLALGNQFGMWQNLHLQQLQQGHQMQLQLRQFEQKQRYRMDGTRMAETIPLHSDANLILNGVFSGQFGGRINSSSTTGSKIGSGVNNTVSNRVSNWTHNRVRGKTNSRANNRARGRTSSRVNNRSRGRANSSKNSKKKRRMKMMSH